MHRTRTGRKKESWKVVQEKTLLKVFVVWFGFTTAFEWGWGKEESCVERGLVEGEMVVFLSECVREALG